MNAKDWDAELSEFTRMRVRGLTEGQKDWQKILPFQDPKILADITRKAQKEFVEKRGPRPMSEKAKRRWEVRLEKNKAAKS